MSVLNERVLVLDKSYQPADVKVLKDIIDLLVIDKAVILDRDFSVYSFLEWIDITPTKLALEPDYAERLVVRSPSIRFIAPKAIIIKDYIVTAKTQGRVKFTRANVFKRDNYTCQYCAKKHGRKELTIDHVHPRSKGGPTNWTNIVTACGPCNKKKDNRTPDQARMRLLNRPYAPTWRQHVEHLAGKDPLWEKLL